MTLNLVLSLIFIIQSVLCDIKYYYQDFTTTLHPFVLPNDSYNLWFERRTDNKLISIPLHRVNLKENSSLADVYGFYIDQLILLITPKGYHLLHPQPESKVLKSNRLTLTDSSDDFVTRFKHPIPFSEDKFLVTSFPPIVYKKKSINYLNLIEEYSLSLDNYDRRSEVVPMVSLVNLEDTISLPLNDDIFSGDDFHFRSQIVDQVYTEYFTFIILRITKSMETNFLLIRFCKTKPLSSMIGLNLTIKDDQEPKSLSLAWLKGKQIMLISFSNQETASIEVYDIYYLHLSFDSIGQHCFQAESPDDAYLLPKIISNHQNSTCISIDEDYRRCSTSRNQYIVGSANNLLKYRLIHKQLDNPIIDVKIITIHWTNPHVMIFLLTPVNIYKCILFANFSINCRTINTGNLGEPKPVINFIHHTGLFRADYVGENNQIINYFINLMDCESFDNCFACRSYGFLWNCGWKSSQCLSLQNREKSDSCFTIDEIHNRRYSDEQGSLTIQLKNMSKKSIENFNLKVLVETTNCKVTKLMNDSVDCEYDGPIHGSIQLEVRMTPKTNVKPKRSVSVIKRTTIIDKPRKISPLGMFDGPGKEWILPVLVTIIVTAGFTITFFVHKIAI